MTAQECAGTLQGRLREGVRESRWYHGAVLRSSLKLNASRAFLFSCEFSVKEHCNRERIHYPNPASDQKFRRRARRGPCPERHQPGHSAGGDLRHHRPLRRGEIHPGPVHEPSGTAHLRHRPGGREGHDRPFGKGAPAPAAENHHDFSGLQPADAADLPEKCLLPHGDRRGPQGPGGKAGGRASRPGGPSGQGERLPRPALRRAEAAGGRGPGPGDGPQGPPLRRGHLRPGPHHHRLHSGAFEGPQRQAGRHRGGHHPPDERH